MIANQETLKAFYAIELGAVSILEEIACLKVPPTLLKMVSRHLLDEHRHADMLYGRFNAGHFNVGPHMEKLKAVRDAMNPDPTSIADLYSVLQILEEEGSATYGSVAEAFQIEDPDSAEIFRRIEADEVVHIAYCKAVDSRLGTESSRAKREQMRKAYAAMNNEAATLKMVDGLSKADGPPVECYSREKHWEMIKAWGIHTDPDSLGNGLVIADQCCGFVDRIGSTNVAYFYGAGVNPDLSAMERIVALIRLRDAIVASARAAGFTRGVTSTNNLAVERGWNDLLGWTRDGGYVIGGRI